MTESEPDAVLREALVALGLLDPSARPARSNPVHALALDLLADEVPVQVETTSVARPAWVRSLPPVAPGTVGVVVADQIPDAVRTRLDEVGWSWLDRRGHLKFRHGAIWIDADVPATTPMPRPSETLRGSVAMGVALAALLAAPRGLEGVRSAARELDAAPATVSVAVRRLVDAGLLTRDHRATTPELFWAVAERWPRPTVGLAGRLRATSEGVVAVGTRAASVMGAPLSHTDDYPSEVMVDGPVALRRLVRELGEAPLASAGTRVTVAPTPLAVRPGDATLDSLPLAATVVVALSLATDPARGLEALEGWEVDGRVW